MRYVGMMFRVIPDNFQQAIGFHAQGTREYFEGNIGCVEEFLAGRGVDAFRTGTQIPEEEFVV